MGSLSAHKMVSQVGYGDKGDRETQSRRPPQREEISEQEKKGN